MEKSLIRHALDVDVDGLRGMTRYTVKAMYDVPGDDGFASIEFEEVEAFTLTWEEIERRGGPASVAKGLREKYGITGR